MRAYLLLPMTCPATHAGNSLQPGWFWVKQVTVMTWQVYGVGSVSNVMNICVAPAVEQKAEAVAVEKRELAEQKAQLHNQQELLRQEQALVEEAAAVAEQDRKQAQDMLKVSAGLWHHPAQAPCGNHSQI